VTAPERRPEIEVLRLVVAEAMDLLRVLGKTPHTHDARGCAGCEMWFSREIQDRLDRLRPWDPTTGERAMEREG
jgi:hypothetical protein